MRKDKRNADVGGEVTRPLGGSLPHAFRQCGFDKLAQCRLVLFPREINTKADSGGLGKAKSCHVTT